MTFAMNVLCLILLVTLVKISQAGVSDIVGNGRDYANLIIEICKEEVGATDDDIKALFTRKEVSYEAKCALDCVGLAIGIVNESGNLQLDKAKQGLSLLPLGNPKTRALEQIIDKCGSVEDPDKCELAYKFLKCLQDGSDLSQLPTKY